MAPRPSSSGISRSMSTRSGDWSCTFWTRVHAVPRGADDPELPAAVHDVAQQPPEERAVVDHEDRRAAQRVWTPCATDVTSTRPSATQSLHRAAVVAAGGLADEWPGRAGSSACRQATMLRSPIWIVPGCARPANMLAPPTSRAVIRRTLAPVLPHQLEQARHARSAGTWPDCVSFRAQRRRRQQHVRQPADARPAGRTARWRRSSRGRR